MSKNKGKKLIEFEEAKAQRNGEVTLKGLTKNLLTAVEEDQIEGLVYVVKHKDGVISLGLNDMSRLEAIGLLESGKLYVLDSMYE